MPQSIQKWIETGYELFAKEGPDDVQIEKPAFKYKTAVSAQMQFRNHKVFPDSSVILFPVECMGEVILERKLHFKDISFPPIAVILPGAIL